MILDLIHDGERPSVLAKRFNIPVSTITTWEQKERESHDRRVVSQLSSTLIVTAQRNIVNAAARIIREDITDNQWFEFEDKVTIELKKLFQD